MSELKLGYHREIFTDFVTASGLLVLGEGLGAWEVTKGLIECYADPKVLVMILGLSPEEEDELITHYTAGLPELIGQVSFKVIKTDTAGGGQERIRFYAGGGVISITSRILLTDMLTGRFPSHLLTGLVLFRAERITEHSLEAFILHILQGQNPEAFVKGVSEAPEPFTAGFNQLAKVMKWMHLPNNILVYPRFHSLVKEELDTVDLEVTEMILKGSQRTTIIQVALVDLIESCLRELVRLNPFLTPELSADIQSLGGTSVEFASLDGLLGRQFDSIIRQQLEPIWNQVSFRTRQLVSELTTLRSLLMYKPGFYLFSTYM